MRTQDLRKKLYMLLRRRAIMLFTVACVVCTGLAATDWASALFILSGDSGADDGAIVLTDDLPKPQLSTTLVKVSSGEEGYDVTLGSGLTVTVRHDGETYTVQARRESVLRMLSRLDIYPSPLEMVYVDLSGGQVEITVASDITFYERTVEEAPYEVRRVENPQMELGQEKVVQEGADGVRTSIYEVVWSNGEEVSRQFVEELDSTAVEEIIEYGTASPPPEPAAVQETAEPSASPVVSVSANTDGSGVLTLADGQQVRYSSVKSMTATAYTAGYGGVGTRTASGTAVHVGTVAVDRNVIPLGTRLYIVTNDGIVYGFSVAEDTGVRGSKVDLYFNTYQECINFGRRACSVYILE